MTGAVHVFCGQSVSEEEAAAIIPGAAVRPPAWAGDLSRLRAGAGDTVLLIDGALHDADPPRHGEILALIASGVTVFGAAGLGAARAVELRPYGMTGIGVIYSSLRTGSLTDADVTSPLVPAGPPPPGAARHSFALAASCGEISHADAHLLTALVTGLPAAGRASWHAIDQAAGPGLHDAVTRLRGWQARRACISYARERDARDALVRVAAGMVTGRQRPGPLVPAPAPQTAPRGGGTMLPREIAPWQLADCGFPQRWRDFVITRTGPPARLVDPAGLTCAQLDHWLAPGEAGSLPAAELAARIVVRSAAGDPEAPVWPVDGPALRALTGGHPAPPGPAAGGHDHLARLWGVRPGSSQALTAAARDRGFRSPAAAIRAGLAIARARAAGPEEQAAQ